MAGTKIEGRHLQPKKGRGLQETEPHHVGDGDHDDEDDNEDLVPAGGADSQGAMLFPIRSGRGTEAAGRSFFLIMVLERFMGVTHTKEPLFLLVINPVGSLFVHPT
jgi:hypothetical protein